MKFRITTGILLLIIVSLAIGIGQAVFCKTLFYGFIQVMEIPTKRDLAMGLGLWYWWRIQLIIAIIACIFLLVVKKRRAQIIVLCSQMLLFALYWGISLSLYPYKVPFLFAVTLLGMALGYFLCRMVKNKILNKK